MARNRGYIIEFISHGRSVKVSAVDPETGTEVSIVGSLQASQDELSALAVRKLEYVLKKRDQSRNAGSRGGLII